MTAYVLKAVSRFKGEIPTALTPPDIANAEHFWITEAQKELVQQKDYKELKNPLNLFADDRGLLQCGGQLQNAEIPYATNYPITLPQSHPFTALIMQDSHLRVCRNGVKEMLTELPSGFWVVRGRSLTRAMVHK